MPGWHGMENGQKKNMENSSQLDRGKTWPKNGFSRKFSILSPFSGHFFTIFSPVRLGAVVHGFPFLPYSGFWPFSMPCQPGMIPSLLKNPHTERQRFCRTLEVKPSVSDPANSSPTNAFKAVLKCTATTHVARTRLPSQTKRPQSNGLDSPCDSTVLVLSTECQPIDPKKTKKKLRTPQPRIGPATHNKTTEKCEKDYFWAIGVFFSKFFVFSGPAPGWGIS